MSPAKLIPVCVFAKPPAPGAVKTRLAAAVGPEAACRLAEAFLADTLAMLAQLPEVRPVLATTAPWSHPEVPAERVWLQGEGDLGERLERILRRALTEAPAAVALGADSPGLPATTLRQALDELGRADAVLGPSADGGFYLLGVRACPAGLLAGVPWSRPTTAAEATLALRRHGLRVASGPPWFDVDRAGDLAELRRRLRLGELVAPRTAAALAQLERRH